MVIPFRMQESPATVQRIMNYLLKGLIGIHVYLYGIRVYSEPMSQHLDRIIAVLDKFKDAQLTVKRTNRHSAMAR